MKGNDPVLIKRKFVRKPFAVEAVEVTEENMSEVSKWCRGRIKTAPGPEGRTPEKFIKVDVKRYLTDRQTQAYVGDWVVTATEQNVRGFKVYTPKAFAQTFDEVVEHMFDTLERMDKRAAEEEAAEEEGIFPEELRTGWSNAHQQS